ncbi:alpha-2-macroglobulin family protein [Rhizobiaceae bacterium BDR2-2]|uniref:Alpha-2-macroglobulin family protein n=1 Tax=Ectorhizobium quercum TaxID=2965071 RepID=A0AAE3N222_9HYPH|nr:alpha-2-macroglobulin family protein [Ectorhizobium quercum]MCX8999358.1 alpha-2-macroglobulin family protein [Ectorhizobium quercum]
MYTILRILVTVCGLAVAGFAGAQGARSIETTPDADYFGFDLRLEKDVSLGQCEALCIENGSCRAFTYNTQAQWCFLKSDFDTIIASPGAVAGRIVEADAGPDIGAPPRLSFLSSWLQQNARTFASNLAVPGEDREKGLAALSAEATAALAAGDPVRAFALYKAVAALNPDGPAGWTGAARAALAVTDNSISSTDGVSAAINGYQRTRSTQERAAALFLLARTLEKSYEYRPALEAYKASLKLADVASVREAYTALHERQGFRMVEHTIDSDTASPRACVRFSEPLLKSGTDYSSFVTLDGAVPQALEATGSQICVEGLSHGGRYRLAFRPGLPSTVGENLEKPVSLDLYVRDRKPSIRFTGENFVLPATVRRSIPVVSVNAGEAALKLYRIGDRGIASLMADSKFLSQMDGYGFTDLEEKRGELVWQGSLTLEQQINRETTTGFPVDEALPERKPGVYVLTASVAGDGLEDWDARATQWFVVSDLGLSTFAGTDGLSVFVRSLTSARPLAEVEVTLLSRGNEVLGTGTTDGEGRVTLSAGLMRGTGALAPAVLTAKAGDDYVFLDMTRAGFDLSDRGVTGRNAPGPLDVLAYSERGIYRAGETVHASALVRDGAANAVPGLPLTFVFERPDGVEAARIVGNDAGLGGHSVDYAIAANAMRGTWRFRVFTDPKTPALAEKPFLVEDFVPDRIEFDMTSEAAAISPDAPVTVGIDGRFLYGAPAAGLTMEGDLAVKPVRSRAGFEGYVFGLADEESEEASRAPLENLPALDENGKAEIEVGLGDLPSTSQWLEAEVALRLREGGGRAVERRLTLPVRQDGPMIGIRPEFSGSVAENTEARFTVIGVEDDARVPLAGLKWKLIKIERNYQWYREGNGWRFEPVLSTSQVADGVLDVAAEGSQLSVPVAWGRYQLEIEGEGAVSSAAFDAGWYVEASSTETPDALEIALDKPQYAAGETAKLKISPRHAGTVLVTVGTDSLLYSTHAEIGADGGEIDIPVTADWSGGTYVAATLFRPGEAQESRMPMRAIGIKWLGIDPAARKLAVTLTPPEQVSPRGPLEIPVQVAGAGADEEAYVTVAAVDVGILNLTQYTMPDPAGWYFGQRRLGIEIRDLYGRLIDGSLGTLGRIRTGGDGGDMALQASPPTEKLVAFFSGPVKLDGEGRALVRFDLPQFNGTARVMAVAWTKTGVGQAQKDVVVRDSVVLTASLPKFLSPGDRSELRVDIAATDAPAGDYRLAVSGGDSVRLDGEQGERTVSLEPGRRQTVTLPIVAGRPGTATLALTLTGADGLTVEQGLEVLVRPATLPVTVRHELAIEPGRSLTVDRGLLAGHFVDGASVTLNVTRAPAFDMAALAMMLDRYPYGCAEQTVSRALPLLYLDQAAALAEGPDDSDLKARVQQAVERILGYQSSSGSFGLWRPGGGDLWLDAYVSDFLTRARERGFAVPEGALAQALSNLENQLAYSDVKNRGDGMAYALYVLARNRKAAISDLRYYADTALDSLSTPMARGQLAAALSLYGDQGRAGSLFRNALALSGEAVDEGSRSDYGSALRDDAALLTLAAESRPEPGLVVPLTARVGDEWQLRSRSSTQEQAWMWLASHALADEDRTVALGVNGQDRQGGYQARMSGQTLSDEPLTVENRGGETVYAAVTAVAAPEEPLPAGGQGYTIERSWYTLDGEETDIGAAVQNGRYLVQITVTPQSDRAQRILVTDLLPAGFEIDNPRIVGSADLAHFDWLPEVEAAHTEFRSDRFVAAFDRNEGASDEITLAYVVRAVTPGTYALPAASVEDMYRPESTARTATGMTTVRPAQ